MRPFNLFRNMVVFLGILFVPVATNARETILHPGDTIRVQSVKYFQKATVGRLRDIQNDSLKFQLQNGQVVIIPCKRIVKLKVVRGTKKNTSRGAIIGGISTGLALGLIAAVDVSDEQGGWFVPTPGQAFVGGFIFGGALGGVIGAIIGSGSHSPRWVEVPVEELIFKEAHTWKVRVGVNF
jgi:hypothetical protein